MTRAGPCAESATPPPADTDEGVKEIGPGIGAIDGQSTTAPAISLDRIADRLSARLANLLDLIGLLPTEQRRRIRDVLLERLDGQGSAG